MMSLPHFAFHERREPTIGEHDVGRLDGHIGSGRPDRDADVGGAKSRRIIHAISRHGDDFAALLQRLDDRFLLSVRCARDN